MTRQSGWSAGIGWLTGLSLAAVLVITLTGVGGIAVARRGAMEEADRILHLETSARAKAIESLLSSSRADLAFLTSSPTFQNLREVLDSEDPREARWRRLEAEGALLLFLRSHPEVTHLAARLVEGEPLLEVARRGGVPVLWVSPARVPLESPARRVVDRAHNPILGRFPIQSGTRRSIEKVSLEATVDVVNLLSMTPLLEDPSRQCRLEDAGGKVLATDSVPRGAEATRESMDTRSFIAQSNLSAEGWSTATPWALVCLRSRRGVLVPLEPVAGRFRTSLMLNLAVMSLAILLGAFAIQQSRRRQALEATAREEARVRELERQLFHAERLITAGRLASGIAHEINNPLEGMSNYLSLASEDLSRGDSEAVRRRLEGVREGVRRVEQIVKRVLDHAEPSAAPTTPVDLASVMRQSLEFVQSRPEFRAIRFDVDLPDSGLSVLGNEGLLGQVFLNFLLNACEAQPGGGVVRLTARREAGRVVAEVADRGPGVPLDDKNRIFEPFYSTKQSTGLGLSVCYSIARQHGAELKVESLPEGGAVFKMIFPEGKGTDG